jgi:hypothetical protein
MAKSPHIPAGLACILILAGCGSPRHTLDSPRPPAHVAPVADVQDESATPAARITNIERLTDMELQLFRAIRAAKAGEAAVAKDLIQAARTIAKSVTLGQLPESKQANAGKLLDFLAQDDDEILHGKMARSLLAQDEATLDNDEKVLDAMRHFFAIGRGALTKDRETVVKEIRLAQQVLESIDMDRLSDESRKGITAIKKKVDSWAKGTSE